MKLWHVAQWGNPQDGPNGHDTQCVIAAPDLETAIKFGSECIERRNGKFRDGLADVIYFLGEDGGLDSEPPQLVIRVWVAIADNMRHNPAWYRKYWEGNGTEWGTELEIYGENN